MTTQKAILSCLLAALAVQLLVNTRSAIAAPTNLVCKEQKGVEENTRKSYSPLTGEKETRTEERIQDLWSIPVTVDPAAGKATVWGRPFELTVEPADLKARETTEEESVTTRKKSISYLNIERKTLRFSYTRLFFLNPNPSFRTATSVSSTLVRKSEGLCAKVKVVDGAKI